MCSAYDLSQREACATKCFFFPLTEKKLFNKCINSHTFSKRLSVNQSESQPFIYGKLKIILEKKFVQQAKHKQDETTVLHFALRL